MSLTAKGRDFWLETTATCEVNVAQMLLAVCQVVKGPRKGGTRSPFYPSNRRPCNCKCLRKSGSLQKEEAESSRRLLLCI